MLYFSLALLLLSTSLTAAAQSTQMEASLPNHIHADQLKSWYDQNKEMIVLDARSKKYFDGTLLPHAKWLSSEASEAEIQDTIPSKDSLVVVYCWGVSCPASGWLYDKLISLGYKNVYEYREGLQEWITKGFPTTKQPI